MSAGQSLVHTEPVFSHKVHIGEEDSGHLPRHVDGGYQMVLQVIKWLGCLSYTQGPMVHPDATVHQTLLLRYQLMTFQPAEDL